MFLSRLFLAVNVAEKILSSLAVPVFSPGLTVAHLHSSHGADLTARDAEPIPVATLTLENKFGADLLLTFVGAKNQQITYIGPSVINHPYESSSTLLAGETTSYQLPEGWNGNINVGHSYNDANTLIEGNIANGYLDLDISYVQGYSASIVCWCNGNQQVIHGCNEHLFAHNACPDQVSEGVCMNPIRDSAATQASTFFKPCENAAFTFPDDAKSNPGHDCFPGNDLTCCIGGPGNPCPRNPVQG